jgi:DNA-binding CsgD family transcriptional regulator
MVKVDYGPWIDLLAEALESPTGYFPVQRIAELLGDGLRAHAVAFSWAEGVAASARVWPPVVPQSCLDRYLSSGAFRADPVMSWFEQTRRFVPQTASRVPAGYGDPRRHAYWTREMARCGVGDRLVVPLHLGAGSHVVFVAVSGERVFTGGDLRCAYRLQPLLRSMHLQAGGMDRTRGIAPATARIGLTTREFAVLSLLADGRPASAIGHRLGISERTVHKHLEHLYRKLGASDRLSAVLTAHRSGILTEAVQLGRR